MDYHTIAHNSGVKLLYFSHAYVWENKYTCICMYTNMYKHMYIYIIHTHHTNFTLLLSTTEKNGVL